MRRTSLVVVVVLVALAAVWLLAPEPAAPPPPLLVSPAAPTSRSIGAAPIASSSTGEGPRLAPLDGASTTLDGEAPEEDFDGRPLSAWIAEWRSEAARPPGTSVFRFRGDPPPTLPDVEGVVRRRSDRAPVAGAKVRWSYGRHDPEQASRGPSTTTDPAGRFRLERLPDTEETVPISGVLLVEAPGHAVAERFAGVAPEVEVEVWLDEPASLEVTYAGDGTPSPRLKAVGGDADLRQRLVDAEHGSGDGAFVVSQDDAFAERATDEVIAWRSLPPGEYLVVGARGSVPLTLAAGEVRRLRLEPPARGALTLTLVTLTAQPAGGCRVRLRDLGTGESDEVNVDERGRFQGQALTGRYRATACLSDAPWQPELGDFVETEVDLGSFSGPGDHELALPLLASFELTLGAPAGAELPVGLDLRCLEPEHECLVRGQVEAGVARGVAHPGRYAAFVAHDPTLFLGEVALPAARSLELAPQELVVRWRPGVALGPEQAVRGRARLSAALLHGRPSERVVEDNFAFSDPSVLTRADGLPFTADGSGRLAADPVLATMTGHRVPFVAPGRYVLEGWSDLGPFRVELTLPAPGGVDVDLSGR